MTMNVRETLQGSGWETVSLTLTSAQAALTTDKSAATVDALAAAKTAIIDVEDGTVALEVRLRVTGSDGDSNVLNLYAMAGDSDHYTLMGTITTTAGTQVFSSGNLFVDTMTFASELWIDDIIVLSDAADGIARISWNTQGYTKFLLIATTLNSATVHVDYRRVG
jgi:hypothetical protein